jgi:hypothetical protein
MIFIPDMDLIAVKHLQDFLKDVGRAVGNGWGHNGWGAEKSLTIETRKDCFGRREEYSKAEGEVIWRIPWAAENVPWNLEITMTYRDEDCLFIQL